jgi:nitroreductase
MRTCPSVREYLSRDVPDEVLYRIFEQARFAPNGGNRQGWRVVVVRDPAVRRQMRDLYQEPWREYVASRYPDPKALAPPARSRLAAGRWLAANLDHAPVFLAFWIDINVIEVTDANVAHPSVVAGGSIFPFVQNVQLALRNQGLGSRITTLLGQCQDQVRMLLAVPSEYALATVMLAGYPAKPSAKLSRKPVESFTSIDRFDGPPLTLPQSL